MNYSLRKLSAPALDRGLRTDSNPWPAARELGDNTVHDLRRYEITWLGENGLPDSMIMSAPAIPIFEQAFSAIARGSLVQTPDGPVAVEDLQPGMEVDTITGQPEQVRWIGSMTITPNVDQSSQTRSHLYRIRQGDFGISMGMPDLVLGSGARIMRRNIEHNPDARLTNIDSLQDGQSVIRVAPLSPVRVYHLGLTGHRLIRVNDVIIETYHPGEDALYHMPDDTYRQFLPLFPHLTTFSDFGPLNHQRSA